MIYNCTCEKCGKTTTIDTEKDKIGIKYGSTYVTAYGYLTTPCVHDCKGSAYAHWYGNDGYLTSTTKI
jgi:hypothetical protein